MSWSNSYSSSNSNSTSSPDHSTNSDIHSTSSNIEGAVADRRQDLGIRTADRGCRPSTGLSVAARPSPLPSLPAQLWLAHQASLCPLTLPYVSCTDVFSVYPTD